MLSDYFPLLVTLNSEPKNLAVTLSGNINRENKNVKKIAWKEENIEQYKQNMRSVREVGNINLPCNEMYMLMINTIKKFAEEHRLLRDVVPKCNRPRNLWFDSECKSAKKR